MNQTTELLNSLSDEQVAAYSADPSSAEHIVVGANRFITVPESLKRIAVQNDHNVKTVTIDCPRYWDGRDLTEMAIYINYLLVDSTPGSYPIDAGDVTIDAADTSVIHFPWVISHNMTMMPGNITFMICAKKTNGEGDLLNHWNSELCKDGLIVSEGMDCLDIVMDWDSDLASRLLSIIDESAYAAVDARIDLLEAAIETLGSADVALQGQIDETNNQIATAQYVLDSTDSNIAACRAGIDNLDQGIAAILGHPRRCLYIDADIMDDVLRNADLFLDRTYTTRDDWSGDTEPSSCPECGGSLESQGDGSYACLDCSYTGTPGEGGGEDVEAGVWKQYDIDMTEAVANPGIGPLQKSQFTFDSSISKYKLSITPYTTLACCSRTSSNSDQVINGSITTNLGPVSIDNETSLHESAVRLNGDVSITEISYTIK